MSSIFLLLRSTVDEKSHIFKVFMRVRTRGVRAICRPMCSLFEHRQELQQSAGSTASVRIISLCFLPFHHEAYRWPADEGNLRVGNGCDLGTFDQPNNTSYKSPRRNFPLSTANENSRSRERRYARARHSECIAENIRICESPNKLGDRRNRRWHWSRREKLNLALTKQRNEAENSTPSTRNNY